MTQQTTLQEARRLVFSAIRELPELTSFGVGLYYTHYRQSKAAIALETRKQQAELETEHALRMVAFCADWINGHHREIKPYRTSYYYKHAVEQWRRDNGDLDPYVHNGCFIAAGVGLGLNYRIDGPNAVFRVPASRQRVA